MLTKKKILTGTVPFHNPNAFSSCIIFSDRRTRFWLLICGFCCLVLSRSNGWNKSVEQVPLKDPNMNDLINGF